MPSPSPTPGKDATDSHDPNQQQDHQETRKDPAKDADENRNENPTGATTSVEETNPASPNDKDSTQMTNAATVEEIGTDKEPVEEHGHDKNSDRATKDNDDEKGDGDNDDENTQPSAENKKANTTESPSKAKKARKKTGTVPPKKPKTGDRRCNWDENFRKLKAYKEMHGHCRVPQRYDVDVKLGEFVKNQRRFRRRGTMKQEKIDLLNSIGFTWEAAIEKRETWEEFHDALVQYHQEHKNCNVDPESDLADWSYKQRCAREGKTLSKTRYDKLQALGFDWGHQPGDHDRYRSQEAPPPTPRVPKIRNVDGEDADSESPQPAKNQPATKKDPAAISERSKKRQWEECMDQLKAFHKANGHAHIPYPYKAHPGLGKWAEDLRKRERQGKISLEEFDLLDVDYGFNWTAQQWNNELDAGAAGEQPRGLSESERFEFYYKKVVAYKEKNGMAYVPSKLVDDQKFAYWANRTRWKQRRGLLSQKKEEMLRDIGFFDKPPDHMKRKKIPGQKLPLPAAKAEQFNAHWEDMYRQICAWQALNGGKGKFPKRGQGETFKLARWVETQRWQAKKGELKQDRVERMLALGMTWDKDDNKTGKKDSQDEDGGADCEDGKVAAQSTTPKTAPRSWQQSFEALKEYHARFGHTDVPRFWEEDNRLGQWCHFQRTTKYRRKPDEITKLDSLGFLWKLPKNVPEVRRTRVQEEGWLASLEELKQFREREGHVEVPQTGEHKTLGHWLKYQRRMGRLDKLEKDRRKKLEKLGVKWETKSDQLFHAGLKKLRAFKKKHGHCHVAHVPPKHKDAGLYNFCIGQREVYRQNKMRLDRKQLLEELGFVWEPSQQAPSATKSPPDNRKRKRGHEVDDANDDGVRPWSESFDALKAYKDEHGDTNVPLGYLKDRYLGHWVAKQKLRKDDLDPAQRRKLNSIDFDWEGKQDIVRLSWDEAFALLEAYKAEHGDCNVPSRYKPDPQLGEWVGRQRTRRKDLKADRFERLTNVGFNFGTTHPKNDAPGTSPKKSQDG